MDDTQGTEHLLNGRRQRLRSINHEQTCPLLAQATINEIAEQGFGHAAVLRVALPEAQNLLLTLGIDAQSDQHRVITQDDPVDHDDREVTVAQRRRQPGSQLLRRHGHVAARDRALRGRMLRHVLRQRFEAPGVLPRRDATGHGRKSVAVERIPVRSEDEARKLHLLALLAPDPRTADRDATTAEGDLTLGRARSAGGSIGISLPGWTAELFPVLLHHRTQDLVACSDAQIEERVLDLRKGSQQRERNLHGRGLRQINDLEVAGLLGMLGHGGSFVVCLPPPYHTEGEGAAALNFLEIQPNLGVRWAKLEVTCR